MYRRKCVIVILLIFTYVQGSAQDSCHCKTNLQQFVNKVTQNYAGYQDKVNARTRASYFKLLDTLNKAAETAETPAACFNILEKYRLFFADKHLQMRASFPLEQGAPPKNDKKEEPAGPPFTSGDLQWKMLGPSTLYIRIKRCRLEYKPVLDSLLKANKTQLDTIPNWIVDFRGNTGGNTDAFSALLPYFYTKPYYGLGDAQWMSPDNTALYKDFYGKYKDEMDSSSAAYIGKIIDYGTRHPNSWYRDKGDTTTYSRQFEYPKRVAVLSDKKNGSSGETFLIMSKGISDKVTIFGENSGGYLDYGNLLRHTIDCKAYTFSIPSRRANYLDHGISYDQTGYPPDIYVPDGEKDWIGFVFSYWNRTAGK